MTASTTHCKPAALFANPRPGCDQTSEAHVTAGQASTALQYTSYGSRADRNLFIRLWFA